MVEFAIEKVKFQYEIYDNSQKLELHSKKVRLRYNPKDLERIFLYELETDVTICECRQKLTTAQTAVEMTETDKENILKHSSKNKSFVQSIKDKLNESMEKGMNVIGANAGDFEPIDPVVLRKENQNDKEDCELMEFFNINEGMKTEDYKPIMSNDMGRVDTLNMKSKKGDRFKFESKELSE